MTHPQVDTLIGANLSDLARELGVKPGVVRDRLNKSGYGVSNDIVYRRQSVVEVEDEIRARVQRAAPSAPCFRCGVRSGCDHRAIAA